jgi:hypothetical protein
MDDWVVDGTEPPASRWPRIDDGTLVGINSQEAQFPQIPGFEYTGAINLLHLLDYDELFPEYGPEYGVMVGAKDADGNNIAGLKYPLAAVPTGTHLGWNINREGYAPGVLRSLTGSYLPFAQTTAERVASGDERPSIEERYPRRQDYLRAVQLELRSQVRDGVLLGSDAREILRSARSADQIGWPTEDWTGIE